MNAVQICSSPAEYETVPVQHRERGGRLNWTAPPGYTWTSDSAHRYSSADYCRRMVARKNSEELLSGKPECWSYDTENRIMKRTSVGTLYVLPGGLR